MLKAGRKTKFVQNKMSPKVFNKLSLSGTVMPLGNLTNAWYSLSFSSPPIYWKKLIHCYLLFFLKYNGCFTEDTEKHDIYSRGFQRMLQLYHSNCSKNRGKNAFIPA